MRSIIVIASLLLSVSAFACPDLTGTWSVCRSTTGASSGATNMVITQAVINGITTYSITSTSDDDQERTTDTMIADGVVKTAVETQDGLEQKLVYTFSCSSNSLDANMALSLNGSEVGVIKASMYKSGTSLIQTNSGHLMGESIDDKIICD